VSCVHCRVTVAVWKQIFRWMNVSFYDTGEVQQHLLILYLASDMEHMAITQ
jgi:hypothetical protein